jgi:EAL domain-containing protein (putative c-di-GMP-specific phosphodiesterase class I)
MYEAKKAGKNRYIFFDENMQKEFQNTQKLKNEIIEDIKKDNFVSFFQPIVSYKDKKVKKVEVLSRWIKDDKVISPTVFMAIIEENIDLIELLTFKQLKEVFNLAKKYDLAFSVNISAKLLSNDNLLKFLSQFDFKDIKKSKISFEVTETSISNDILKSSEILAKIKEMGFGISLDDFGTGYSSLSYLRNLPIDTLKIDRQFVLNLEKSKKDEKLLMAILKMANILDMNVVIEGIEEKKQYKKFKDFDFVKFQGFYFYKPMQFKELKKLIKKRK